MIRVVTPSRLHFGLIAPAHSGSEQTDERVFGGAGLMIEKPGLLLEMTEDETWSCEGPLTSRAMVEWKQIQRKAPWLFKGLQRHRIRITSGAREHVGLGTGTQLSLAMARALLATIPHNGIDLAHLTGRGARSGIGYHGFSCGGFLVDGGKVESRSTSGVAPLVARHEFPNDWRLILLVPRTTQGCHGARERGVFEQLVPVSQEFRNAQCARLFLEVVPALAEGFFPAFSEALHQYNRAAGEPFRGLQGGCYSSPEVESLIEKIRALSIPGAGQSSWGPTVFAITQDEEQAEWLVGQLRQDGTLSNHDFVITRAQNHGACVTVD